MDLQQSIKNILTQLSDSLFCLNDHEYTTPSNQLFGASIGQHVRHIIELFECLYKGYQTGLVNYEKRERSRQLETDKNLARCHLLNIYESVQQPDKTLLLEANYTEQPGETILIGTNYYRELVYNLEHTVHHMALIRIGFKDVSNIEVPEEFGVAASTLKYKKGCVQ